VVHAITLGASVQNEPCRAVLKLCKRSRTGKSFHSTGTFGSEEYMCVWCVCGTCVALTGRTRKSPAGSLFIGPLSHWTHREDNYSLHRPGSIQRTAAEFPLRMAIVDMGRPRTVPPREPTHGLCWVLGLGKQPHATLVQATFARGLFKQVCVAANATQWTDHTFSVESTRGCMHRRWVVQVTPRTKL